MKKRTLALTAFMMAGALLLGLSACSEPEASAPAPAARESGEPADPRAVPASERLALTLPGPLTAYEPPVEYLPLTDSATHYEPYVSGPASFVRLSDGNVLLPPGAVNYDVAHSVGGDELTPQCVALYNAQGSMAVMRLDGSMATGYRYETAFDASGDYLYNQAFAGYLVVFAQTEGARRCGVLDIRTGREVIAPAFDEIELMDGYLLARGGDIWQLLDYGGKLLYDFGRAVVDVVGWHYALGDGGDSFTIDREARRVYKQAYDNCFDRRGGFYLNWRDGVITVRDEEGRHLATRAGWNNHYFLDGRVYLLADGWFTRVDADGTVTDLAYTCDPHAVCDLRPDGDNLVVRLGDDNGGGRVVTLDPAGAVIREEAYAEDAAPTWHYGPIVYENWQYSLRDGEGRTLIPAGAYDALFQEGEFIIARKRGDSYYFERTDIFNLKGEKLLSGVFGFMDRLTAGGRMVCYTGDEQAVLLSADGAVSPVRGGPAVTLARPE